jgi:glycosyltransferase involved in cell wall biosynthesis
MSPRVSVVIKSYNHATFVAQSIQSILDQSFQDFEIVVTDDASNDGTPDVIRSFADPRINLQVFPKNRGISAAMNATLARARGELIAILNSDDYALPGRLERQVAFLDANPDIAAVFTMPMAVDENGAPTAPFFDFRRALELADFSRRSWLRQFYFFGNVLCAPSAMIRRATYASCGEYDLRMTNVQDLDMWVRLAARAPIHVMSDELTAFRVRDNNQNMSAPRLDTELRSQFEFAHILKRFRTLPLEVLEETFAQDLSERKIDSSTAHHIWLAELALTVPSPAHRLFALETLFETAQSDEDIARFRDRLGTVDVFGIQRARECDVRIGELHAAVAAAYGKLATREAQIGELDHKARELGVSLQRLINSRSWRLTAPLRALLAALKRA